VKHNTLCLTSAVALNKDLPTPEGRKAELTYVVGRMLLADIVNCDIFYQLAIIITPLMISFAVDPGCSR